MGFAAYAPDYSGVALLYAQILENIQGDPIPDDNTTALLTQLLDTPVQVVRSGAPQPILWLVASNATTTFFALGGARNAKAISDLCDSWLGQAQQPVGPAFPTSPLFGYWPDRWASDILLAASSVTILSRPEVRICGHSLGGVIGWAIAARIQAAYPAANVHLCTFGNPKVVRFPSSDFTTITCARFTNPADNVPSLPPLATEAPDVYAALNQAQWNNLNSYRQPRKALSLRPGGTVVVQDDPPSVPVTFSSLQALCAGNTGLFGAGHGIGTYVGLLKALYGNVPSNPALTTVAPQTIGNIPVALPGPTISPAAPNPPIDPAPIVARQVAFRAAATANDGIYVDIPNPNRMKAVFDGQYWNVHWMGFPIAIGPTKKKARALARHMNRFLKIYQGVGESQSNLFSDALAEYLTDAADPAKGYTPTLRDG